MQCMFAADWLKRLGPSGAPTIAAINSSHASRWGATLTPLSCGEDRVPCHGIHGRFNTCRCVRVRGAKAGKAGQLTQAKIARTTQRHGDDEGAMTGDPIFYSKINRGYGPAMVPFAWPVLWPFFIFFVWFCWGLREIGHINLGQSEQSRHMLTNVDTTRLWITSILPYLACLLCNTPRCWSCASLSPNRHFRLQTVGHWSLDLWRHTRWIDEYTYYTEPKAMFHNGSCPNHTMA